MVDRDVLAQKRCGAAILAPELAVLRLIGTPSQLCSDALIASGRRAPLTNAAASDLLN
jgi:hypothetical protein